MPPRRYAPIVSTPPAITVPVAVRLPIPVAIPIPVPVLVPIFLSVAVSISVALLLSISLPMPLLPIPSPIPTSWCPGPTSPPLTPLVSLAIAVSITVPIPIPVSVSVSAVVPVSVVVIIPLADPMTIGSPLPIGRDVAVDLVGLPASLEVRGRGVADAAALVVDAGHGHALLAGLALSRKIGLSFSLSLFDLLLAPDLPLIELRHEGTSSGGVGAGAGAALFPLSAPLPARRATALAAVRVPPLQAGAGTAAFSSVSSVS